MIYSGELSEQELALIVKILDQYQAVHRAVNGSAAETVISIGSIYQALENFTEKKDPPDDGGS